MTTPDWYRIADQRPPLSVHVPVTVDGREFLAVRGLLETRKERRERWAVVTPGGRVAPLDPALEARLVAGEGLWRPRDAALWVLPLPAPVRRVEPGRMTTEQQAFSATEAAAEMEADREAARASRDEPEAPDRQWWLTTAPTYSQPGAISMREAEGRIMRALLTEAWVRVERPGCPSFGRLLALQIKDLPLSPEELALQDPAPERWMPSPRDQDDMLTALGWLTAAFPCPETVRRRRRRDGTLTTARHTEEMLVLRLRARAPALAWRTIGASLAISATTARKLYAEALACATRAANGAP